MMRSPTFVAALCALSPLSLRAQNPVNLPQLTILEKGVPRALELKEATITVALEGYFVETIFELEFFNDTDRRQEGEFSLQLPPESTVSTYAIDIIGRMRPAVSVEKEKARNAYESIKRKMVDPGLVEREANNVYKTRVFPLEAKKSKHVRIGFIQELGKFGTYTLPLSCANPIGRFELKLTGRHEKPTFKELTLAQITSPDPGTSIWSAQDIALNGSLSVNAKLPSPNTPFTRIESTPDGTRHFVIQQKYEPRPKEEIPSDWKKIRLIWDCSYSGRFRDHTKEFAALADIWKWLGSADVMVQSLSTELTAAEKFTIVAGDGKAIESLLAKSLYDGSADYSLIKPTDGVTLILSDGALHSPLWAPRSGAKQDAVFLLNSAAGSTASELRAFASSVSDLASVGWLDELKQHRQLIQVEGLPEGDWHLTLHEDHVVVIGKIPAITRDSIRIHGPGFRDILLPPETRASSAREEWNLARRIWAQGRLSALEWEGNREKVRTHAMAERLASDFTSLIILERMADHILYQIPPPEPELLIEYQRAILSKKPVEKLSAVRAWENKLAWHKTRFPWLDAELESEAGAVAIWVKASRTAFPEEKLNLSALQPFEKWLPAAEKVIESSSNLGSKKDFEQWKSELGKQMEDLKRIRETNDEIRAEGPVHVSVRGFVNQRGIITGNPPLYLKNVIDQAGGPNHFGSLARVYLYHDGLRTGFNLLSETAAPVKLRSGDMVVVENLSYGYTSGFGAADPFAVPFADPFFDERGSARGGGDPVFEQPGTVKPTRRVEWKEAGDATAKNKTKDAIGGTFQPSATPVASRELDGKFIESLKRHPSSVEFYRHALSGNFGSSPVSPATVIETARYFYQNSQKDTGYRVLTTLCELQGSPIEATRSLAYWLAAFGDLEKAEALLKSLAGLAPDESTRALVLLDLGRLTGKRDYFQQSAESDLLSNDSLSVAPIALTDFFALKGRARAQLSVFQANPMASDIRLVITTMGGTAAPNMTSPVRPDTAELVEDGGRWVEHPRVSEFQVRRALPGAYQASLVRWADSSDALTVHLVTYIHWADGREEKHSETLLMDTNELSLPGVEFGWGEL